MLERLTRLLLPSLVLYREAGVVGGIIVMPSTSIPSEDGDFSRSTIIGIAVTRWEMGGFMLLNPKKKEVPAVFLN